MRDNETRSPSLFVIVNNININGIIGFEVTTDSYLGANRFRLRASLTASGPTVWSQNQLLISIQVEMNGVRSQLILGYADRVLVDPIYGEVIVDGRDLTSTLISFRMQQAFENQTASEVAIAIANATGLQAAVTPTTQLIGRYFQNGHTRTILDQHTRASTAWDLLIWLASQEGFDVWVDGNTLNFAATDIAMPTLYLAKSDCISLELARSLSLSGPLNVVVKSWNIASQLSVQQSFSLNNSSSEGGSTSNYVLVRPNLTSAAAQALAQAVGVQMASHGRTVQLEMPGDLTTMPRMQLSLCDTQTDWDNNYTICSVERRMSFAHGFTQSLEARSQSSITS